MFCQQASSIHTTHASFLREPGGGGSTSSCKTKYLPLGNLLSLCKKVAGAYSFYLFFEILWKTAIGKFLRDQSIMVQWFGSFNHGYLFIGILTLVQM